jgi:hypothetical protein
MFDGLFEYRLTIYVGLAIVGIVLVALWFRDRRRTWLYALGGLALLAGAFFLLDLTIETPPKQIRRKLQEMAQGVKKKDSKAILAHLSDQFEWEGMNKAEFHKAVDHVLQMDLVTDLVIWDEKFPDSSGKVIFQAKPKGAALGKMEKAFYRIRAEFVRDPDKQWRLKTFTVHDPVNGERIEIRGFLPR